MSTDIRQQYPTCQFSCTLSSLVFRSLLSEFTFISPRLQFYPHDSNSIFTTPILSRADIIVLLRFQNFVPLFRNICLSAILRDHLFCVRVASVLIRIASSFFAILMAIMVSLNIFARYLPTQGKLGVHWAM